MISLNFGPSEYITYCAPGDTEPDMLMDIPDGQLPKIPEKYMSHFHPFDQAVAKQTVFNAEKSGHQFPAVEFPLIMGSSMSCCNEYKIIMPWIKERGEWIAIMYENWIESMPKNDECYSGPYSANEYCKRKILEAYKIPETALKPDDAVHMNPDDLAKK